VGVITNLLKAHSEKQLQDKTMALQGYQTLLSMKGALPDATREWALDNILSLTGDVTGGGGGKGGKSGGGGKDGKPNPFRSILAAMSGLNPAPAAPKPVGQRPQQMTKTAPEMQQEQQAQTDLDRKNKLADEQGSADIRRKSAVQQYQEETPEAIRREQGRPVTTKPSALDVLTDEYFASGKYPDREAAQKRAGEVLTQGAETKAAPKPKPQSAREKMAENIVAAGVESDPKKADAMAAKLIYDQALEKLKATGRSGGAGIGAMDPESMHAIAEGVIKYKLPAPPFGMSANSPLRAQYLKAYGDVMKELGAGGAGAERAEFAAQSQSLNKLISNLQLVQGAEKGTTAEIDRAITLSKAVPRTQAHLLNGLLQRSESSLADYPQLARFREAALAARNRYASMISTARGGGGATTNAARQEADQIINTAMAAGSFEGAAQEMKVGIQNVMKGLQDEVKQARGELIKQNGGGQKYTNQPLPGGITLDEIDAEIKRRKAQK